MTSGVGLGWCVKLLEGMTHKAGMARQNEHAGNAERTVTSSSVQLYLHTSGMTLSLQTVCQSPHISSCCTTAVTNMPDNVVLPAALLILC